MVHRSPFTIHPSRFKTMSIISVENLSKQYRIGTRLPYKTLRETIMSAITAPVELFRRNGKNEDNTIWALKDVSFEVQEGEVLGIIGRNGAGKTTLLKILSRVTEPTEGAVKLRGRVASLLEVGTGFHPELTGRENIFLNGSILGMSRQEIKSKFDEIVAFAEIEKFLDTPVKRYSSGMYVRLAFAVAAHLEPEILIVDEVLAVGDAQFQKKCLGKMGEVAKGGRTVLLVSHNMSAISGLCENAIWLDNGRLAKKGPADEIIRNYIDNQAGHLNESAYIFKRSEEATANKDFYFSHVEILNEQGKHTTAFSYGEKIVLIVNISGEPRMNRFSLTYHVYNEFQQLVSAGASAGYHDICFERGVKKIKIEIGPLILTSGTYTISLGALYGGDVTAVSVDSWDNAVSFTLTSQPFRPGRDLSFNDGVCIIPHSFTALE